jgi:hypothetical protein
MVADLRYHQAASSLAEQAIEAQSSETAVAERQLELSLQQARYEAAHARRRKRRRLRL